MTTQTFIASRSPRGMDTRRVPVALYPSERAELERLASLEGRTLSAQARVLLLRVLNAEKSTTISKQAHAIEIA